jgi:hypothetical protein
MTFRRGLSPRPREVSHADDRHRSAASGDVAGGRQLQRQRLRDSIEVLLALPVPSLAFLPDIVLAWLEDLFDPEH